MPVIAIAAVGAAALAAVIVVALLPASTPGASPVAARLIAKIATAAARQPTPQVRNSQFWYMKTWVAGMGCNAATGKCVLDKPHESQIWQAKPSKAVVPWVIFTGVLPWGSFRRKGGEPIQLGGTVGTTGYCAQDVEPCA
jgi:hypothetical protein